MFNRDITFTDINELVETYENSKIRGYNYDTVIIDDYNENND
jgi:hypothetical protein